MKKQILLAAVTALLLSTAAIGQIGIGTNQPDGTAVLDLTSTERGFLPPRMTEAERNAISNPAEGLVIYNLDDHCINFWNAAEWVSLCDDGGGASLYPSGYVHCDPGNPTEVLDVYNPATGKTWMDRNLGASRAATSSTDADAYGDYYQWGRGADGHQCSNSPTTSTLSATDQPGHGDFILISSSPYDWRSPQNDNLWQGVSGINNPCPTGYRVPTEAELEAERVSWSSGNATGAYASVLKFIPAGRRNIDGAIYFAGGVGFYFSSTIIGTGVMGLHFNNTDSSTNNGTLRVFGQPIRCIKD